MTSDEVKDAARQISRIMLNLRDAYAQKMAGFSKAVLKASRKADDE